LIFNGIIFTLWRSLDEQCFKNSQAMTPQEEAHLRILKIIEKEPEITQRGLAKALGISLGKINFQLNALVDKGFVKIGNFQRSGDRLNKIIYLLTPEGINNRIQLTRNYLARKEAEYIALQAELKELRKENLDLLPERDGPP